MVSMWSFQGGICCERGRWVGCWGGGGVVGGRCGGCGRFRCQGWANRGVPVVEGWGGGGAGGDIVVVVGNGDEGDAGGMHGGFV